MSPWGSSAQSENQPSLPFLALSPWESFLEQRPSPQASVSPGPERLRAPGEGQQAGVPKLGCRRCRRGPPIQSHAELGCWGWVPRVQERGPQPLGCHGAPAGSARPGTPAEGRSSAGVCGLGRSRHRPRPRPHRGLWDVFCFGVGSTLSTRAGPSCSLPEPVPGQKGRRVASVSLAGAEYPQPASAVGKATPVLVDCFRFISVEECMLAPAGLWPSTGLAVRASALPFAKSPRLPRGAPPLLQPPSAATRFPPTCQGPASRQLRGLPDSETTHSVLSERGRIPASERRELKSQSRQFTSHVPGAGSLVVQAFGCEMDTLIVHGCGTHKGRLAPCPACTRSLLVAPFYLCVSLCLSHLAQHM